MMTRIPKPFRSGRIWAIAGSCLLLALGGCGLDKVEIPGLTGPSTTGIGLRLHVTPDVLLADAVSTAVVEAEVRGPNGEPLPNRTIFFAVTDENQNYVDLGTLYSTQATYHPPAPQTTEITNSSGVARVVYRVPERISVTAIQPVFILGRIVSDDAQGQVYRSVKVELRPAEVRRFPDPGGAVGCAIVVDPPVGPYAVGEVVRFRTASTGNIVQYFWDFGDGSVADKPDTSHAWRAPGAYSVTHVVTAGSGEQDNCSAAINVS